MKKLIFIALCLSIYCNYCEAQNIQNLITSVYLNKKIIDKNNEDLSIKIIENKKGFILSIRYRKIKSRVFLSHSDFANTDSISYEINCYAKRRDVDIFEIDTSFKLRNGYFGYCIRRSNSMEHSCLNLYKHKANP